MYWFSFIQPQSTQSPPPTQNRTLTSNFTELGTAQPQLVFLSFCICFFCYFERFISQKKNLLKCNLCNDWYFQKKIFSCPSEQRIFLLYQNFVFSLKNLLNKRKFLWLTLRRIILFCTWKCIIYLHIPLKMNLSYTKYFTRTFLFLIIDKVNESILHWSNCKGKLVLVQWNWAWQYLRLGMGQNFKQQSLWYYFHWQSW